MCSSVALICKANNSNSILFLSLTKNRSRCCKNIMARKQEKEGWVWTEGVLGQTAELHGEILTWAQVGWWMFAHFARVWAICSGCAGLWWYNGTPGTVEPVLFLVNTGNTFFVTLKQFCILNADGNMKILYPRADIVTPHIVPRCFMPEVNIFTHRVGANIWQVPVCWELCPWHCSSVHKNSSRSWNLLSPFLRLLLYKFFKCVSPMVQKLDYLLQSMVPCQPSLLKDHLSILSQNWFSYG